MNIRKAMDDSCEEVRANAVSLLDTKISDTEFLDFLKGLGDMKWIPFTLPVPKELVVVWKDGQQLPNQQERRAFLQHIVEVTHPSLL